MLALLDQIIQSGKTLTPMMQQYYLIKKNYLNYILLFRLGDFYEAFFEDGVTISKVLNIVLTHRGKIDDVPIPMAGIPHHALENYIDRLIAAGLKIAICEQTGNESNGLFERKVTQICGPGLPFDLTRADTKNYFLLSFNEISNAFFITILDLTTGEFFGQHVKTVNELIERIYAYNPKEIVTTPLQLKKYPSLFAFIKETKLTKSFIDPVFFGKNSFPHIAKLVPEFTSDRLIPKEIYSSLGAISYYAASLSTPIKHIKRFTYQEYDRMQIPLSTLISLEILPTNTSGSLLELMDHTLTSSGKRKLKNIFITPTKNRQKINERLDKISFLIKDPSLELLREKLPLIHDLERIIAKLIGPRAKSTDLLLLATSIKIVNELLPHLDLTIDITSLNNIVKNIDTVINFDGTVNYGVNKERDHLYDLSNNHQQELKKLESSYRQKYKLSTLKIKQNNQGIFVEISRAQADKLPQNIFIQKNTLVSSIRFVTEELQLLEKEIIYAKTKLEQVDADIINELIINIGKHVSSLHSIAESIAKIDTFQSFAWTAIQYNFSRPSISHEKLIQLEGAFHPLIKYSGNTPFIPHNLTLNQQTFLGLITGPNMAGKTTVMREVAIIQFLVQIGSFVPAKVAICPIIDNIFARIGARDNIQKGQSTFMVEMVETSEILRHATKNSLIIVDEIGRGTSTKDGVSIAWAIIEYLLSETKALTLFSTHYHELVELVERDYRAKNLTMEVKRDGEKVEFLYNLINGHSSDSFGIYVASLAGIPPEVLSRAETILQNFEKDNTNSIKIEKIISDVNDTTSPIEVKDKLYQIQEILCH